MKITYRPSTLGVYIGSEAQPASYPRGTGGSFPWGKAAGT
jgi:hypothetical protein